MDHCEACGTQLPWFSLDDHMCSTTRVHPWLVRGWAGLHKATAILSPDGTHRYRLTRDLADGNNKTMTYIMLNPSTADHETNDATLRFCLAFAEREGCGSLEVVNLFSYRTPDPKVLVRVAKETPEALKPGPVDRMVLHNVSCAPERLLVAAWGKRPSGMPPKIYDAAVARWTFLTGSFYEEQMLCLGTNKDGSPKHPLYRPHSTPLVPWTP